MSEVSIVATGDLVLDETDVDGFFALVTPALQAADVVIGHVETPYVYAPDPDARRTGGGAPPDDPRKLAALQRAGFNVVTLAGNHVFDQGAAGVRDTLDALHALGIATTGSGMNIAEARSPAIIKRNGVRVGVLGYLAVGPESAFAGPDKPGAAFVRVPGMLVRGVDGLRETAHAATADPSSVVDMQGDVRALRPRVDVVVVAFHKGIVHTPVTVLDYERLIAHAAIDAGADVVIGHHAHICRGIELYKGRPIYHGLGNFVTVTNVLSDDPAKNPSPERLEYARRRKQVFGFAPDPEMPSYYAFHPESRNTLVAKITAGPSGAIRPGFVPVWIDEHARPRVATRATEGPRVLDYLARITGEAGLGARFTWDGDEVLIS